MGVLHRRKARQGIPADLVIEIRDAAPDVDSLDSASSTGSVDSVSSVSSVGSIDSPNNAEGTNSTTASLLTRRSRLLGRMASRLRIDTRQTVSPSSQSSSSSPSSPKSPKSPSSPGVAGLPSPKSPITPTLGATDESSPPTSPVSPASPTEVVLLPTAAPVTATQTRPPATTISASNLSPPLPALPAITSSIGTTATTSTTPATSTVSTTSIASSSTAAKSEKTSFVTSTRPASSSTGVRQITVLPLFGDDTAATTTLQAIPSATAANDTLTNKAKQSDSGQVGVHIALPVVLSVGVMGALLFFLWRWYKRCHTDKSSGIDQANLAGGAAPMGQHDQTHFRSDESVMADLMDAAYAAENGGLRNSQMTRPNGVFADEKMTARHQIRQMDGPQASLSPRTRGPVFSWLGGVRSGAPTVRGSVAVPQSVVSSDRSTIAAWPRNLEPTNYPIRYMEQERIRPSSPAQTAITQNTSAHTESSWNTWGVEQHRPSEKKKGLLGRLKAGLTGSL